MNGVRARDALDACRFKRQSYDFTNGEVHRSFTFTVDRVTVTAEMVAFCSQTLPSLVTQEVTISTDSACELAVQLGIDTTGAPGHFDARATESDGSIGGAVDGSLRWASLGDVASVGAAYVTECDDAQAKCSLLEAKDLPLQTTYQIGAQPGERYRIRQFSTMVPSPAHSVPDQQAVRLATEAKRKGS